MEQSFIAYIENSIKNNWDLDALTDYKGATLQYKDVARKIEKLHIIFEESGIRKGDKIAVCGRNSSHWGVTFLATLTYGAVIVPILHEFKADNVHNIVNHSEAKLLFVGDMVWENLNESAMPLLEGILMMNDFTLLVSRSERLTHAREHLNEMFGKKYPKNFRREHIEYHKDEPEELAVINYTSGTTSYSKGVMLPYRSLWSNTKFAFEVLELEAGDKIVSMLPMAHMYGLAFEFLYEFSVGCHIYFLTRMPSPKIIFQALFYPVTNAKFDTDSYRKFAEGPWLTRRAMKWFWNAYAPDRRSRNEITASPLRASLKDLAGLPPALVITAQNDVLRDEGEAYAQKLMEAGVEVTALRCNGTIHDFMMLNALAESAPARLAVSVACDALRNAFRQ